MDAAGTHRQRRQLQLAHVRPTKSAAAAATATSSAARRADAVQGHAVRHRRRRDQHHPGRRLRQRRRRRRLPRPRVGQPRRRIPHDRRRHLNHHRRRRRLQRRLRQGRRVARVHDRREDGGSVDLRLPRRRTGINGKFHAEIDGVNVTGSLTVPNTGGWQTWTTVTKTGVNLTAGSTSCGSRWTPTARPATSAISIGSESPADFLLSNASHRRKTPGTGHAG